MFPNSARWHRVLQASLTRTCRWTSTPIDTRTDTLVETPAYVDADYGEQTQTQSTRRPRAHTQTPHTTHAHQHTYVRTHTAHEKAHGAAGPALMHTPCQRPATPFARQRKRSLGIPTSSWGYVSGPTTHPPWPTRLRVRVVMAPPAVAMVMEDRVACTHWQGHQARESRCATTPCKRWSFLPQVCFALCMS